jgi:hypothetical protein
MYRFLTHFHINYRLTAVVTLLALLALFESQSAHAQQPSAEGVGTVTEPLGESYEEPKKLAPNVARVTFYRPAHGYHRVWQVCKSTTTITSPCNSEVSQSCACHQVALA